MALKEHRRSSLLKRKLLLDQINAAAVFVFSARKRRKMQHDNHRLGTTNRPRVRKHVEDIYNELGPIFFRRAYRMEYEDFLLLCQLLDGTLNEFAGTRAWGPNGRVPNDIRVAMAIRYFAGGSVYDIMLNYGVSAASFYLSMWMVVDAVRVCPELQIRYPESYDDQWRIAEGYQRKSRAGFNCCAGAIDGLLVWINKPTIQQCEESGSGQMKFFCGRKNKYALNMQAVCDHNSRFLDVSILYGGASSDLVAFEASKIYDDLQNKSLLAPTLCIFGDNAYINSSFMATPYPGNVTAEQDAYNFFHSQLRITSECSFGRHMTRWGCLQKKIVQSFTIAKSISLVLCLCQLSNYCTDASLSRREVPEPPRPMEEDVVAIRLEGGVPLRMQYRPEIRRNVALPIHLMDAGHHGDGVNRHVRRTQRRRDAAREELPREILCAHVARQNLRRPMLPIPNPNNNQN